MLTVDVDKPPAQLPQDGSSGRHPVDTAGALALGGDLTAEQQGLRALIACLFEAVENSRRHVLERGPLCSGFLFSLSAFFFFPCCLVCFLLSGCCILSCRSACRFLLCRSIFHCLCDLFTILFRSKIFCYIFLFLQNSNSIS